MREWWSKLRAVLTGRAAIDDDLAEELRSHVAMETDGMLERGLTPEAARAAAQRHFGNSTAVAESAREAWAFSACESLLHDVRYALRAMFRKPAFSLVVILTFALGVGVNTAIFSVVDTVLLKPLPFPEPERLVSLGEANAKSDFSVTWVNFNSWRQNNHTFSNMAAFEFSFQTLTGRSDAATVRGLSVTAPFFHLLGMRPLMGRLLEPQDDRAGAPATAVVSHRFWESQLGSDPHIVGQNLVLDGVPYEIVGVMAPQWTPWRDDYYLSLGRQKAGITNRARHQSIHGLALLKPGVTLANARADLDAIMRHLAESDPGPESEHRSFGTYFAAGNVSDVRGTLLMLMGAAGLILLIACANVASLLLARNTARASELALRKAIGAGQFRLVRQLLTENIVIALAGGLAGVLFAFYGLRVLVAFAPPNIPRLAETGVDLPALFFACAITIAAGLLAALAPVLAARRIDLTIALKEGARVAGSGKRGQSARSLLVVGEVAITLILAFGSGLLLRSLAAARSSDPGFDTSHLLTFTLDLPGTSYRNPAAIRQFYSTLTEDLSRLPGVAGVSTVHCPPPMGDCGDWFYSMVGRPDPERDQVPIALFNNAAPGYFRMMSIPLRQGREFNETDRPKGAPVAIINEKLARMWWPNESAVGHQIKVGGPYQDGNLVEVVGVAANVRQSGLDSEPMEEIYRPAAQDSTSGMVVMIRTASDPAKVMPAIRARVAALDGNLPIQSFGAMDAALGAGLARRRFSTALLAMFAGLAMLLAAVGIYGLLNYWVASREAEIAVRLALGASPARILRWTSAHALRLALAGVAIGAVGGWFAARLLRDLVFGIPTHHPESMLAAVAAVMALALLAAAIPSWRAARVDAAVRLHQG